MAFQRKTVLSSKETRKKIILLFTKETRKEPQRAPLYTKTKNKQKQLAQKNSF